jgi:hypothetical protein
VIAWTSYRQDGYRSSVFAQRFADPIILDADGDNATDALTDGLLVLRYLFGFRGSSLSTGAVNLSGCSRCTGSAIAEYLDGLGLSIDIDGDGDLHPLTDGLLALRYLFGLRGASLVDGVVDLAGCNRCDAASIETYLEELTQ